MMQHDWSGLRFIGGGLDECQAFTNGTTVYRFVPLKSSRGPKMMQHDWNELRFIGGGLDECQAFTNGTTVYRSIPLKSKTGRWNHTHHFLQSEQYKALAQQGLILPAEKIDVHSPTFPSTLHNDDRENRVIYQSPFIPFGLNPTKYGTNTVWTRAHFVEFLRALASINHQLDGYICEEASLGNFIFNGSQPMLVDLGAIAKANEHTLAICKTSLARTLTNAGFGIHSFEFQGPEVWKRILDHCDTIDVTEPKNEWDEYNDRPLPEPGKISGDKEINWLREIVSKYDIRTVLDIGGNDGYFAFAIADNFVRVCSIDRARNAITKGFWHAKKHNSNVVFYVVDLLNPPPAHRRTYTKELMVWTDRLEADCVVLSSVMHHLCHQNKDLAWQIEQCGQLARKYLLFEYIDKKDPTVRDWPQTWSREQFFSEVQKDWLLIGSLDGYAGSIPSRPHRKWYAFERKQSKPFQQGVEGFRAWHSAKLNGESAN